MQSQTSQVTKNMARFIILLIMLGLARIVSADENPNLDSLYHQLDDAVEQLDHRLAERQEQINALKVQYAKANEPMKHYLLAEDLFDAYCKLINDSALAYGKLCIKLADEMGRDDLKTKSYIRLAQQYVESGGYQEAQKYFRLVDTAQLNTVDMKAAYFEGLNHLYGELAFYSSDSDFKQQSYKLSDAYRDSIIALVDTTSILWLSKKVSLLFTRDQFEEAKHYSDIWMTKVEPETPDYAYMAYIRSEIYRRLNQHDMESYWLASSANSDLRCGIMDQASLWMLAGRLSSEGDLERAYRYVECSWRCATMFNAHLRSWQISPVLTVINDNYKNQLRSTNHMLRILVGAVSILALVLLGLYLYVRRKRRQLAAARNELKEANQELVSLNEQLSDKNDKLLTTNALLSDANRVKDEYIGKFLSICSEYIDKLDNYRIKVNRKLKANQYADLLRMTGSEQLKEDELKELFDNFDAVFLRLFPTFVDEFNSLLRPEEHIVPSGKSRLNTDLRIFALIRLGIDESSKIAEFLHYSPNSIYTYRARIKNKAAGNRDDFEQRVKEIGIQV